MPDKIEISNWFKGLQDEICKEISSADGKGVFEEDNWERQGGGGGRTRIIRSGNVIEKGGVNFSAVHGRLPKNILTALKVNDEPFYATGVSIVLHPVSPMVPIIHMNVRYFEVGDVWWFGGGIDLTPHYVNKEDAAFFHDKLKEVCDSHDPNYYPRFKQWADDYFFISHRNETRGIGGIFFDRLGPDEDIDKEMRFNFVKSVGEAFAPIYIHLIDKNRSLEYGENERRWQLLRRGRYVEFNLVYDKGTKFGLQTEGRVESILMSLPLHASWEYNFVPPENSPESETLGLLKKGISWL